MFDGIMNALTSPLAFLRGAVTGTAGNVSSVVSGGLGSAISGAVTGVGVAALGTMFLPDILNFLRHAGKPEWASALSGYLHANPNFLTQMMHAGALGAAAGGTLGGGAALASSVQSGFVAVPEPNADPARNGARGEALAQNAGQALGSAALLGAVALGGVGIYNYLTSGSASRSASTGGATPGTKDISSLVPPQLPAGKLEAADVAATPTRPVAVQNAQVSVGAVRQ